MLRKTMSMEKHFVAAVEEITVRMSFGLAATFVKDGTMGNV